MKPLKMLIAGQMVDGDRRLDVINPATGEVFASASCASPAQLDAAVAAAKAAFPAWSRTTFEARREMIGKFADAVGGHSTVLARLLTQEQGKPLAESTAEVTYMEAFIRSFAELELPNQVLEDSDTRKIQTRRKPLGVVAAIIPWNFPLLIIAFKMPMAVLAGNTVVLKPAATTPLTALKIAELIANIFPPGVVNIIADNNDLGDRLAGHPDVAKVSFTGSTQTGRKVMAAAAATIKRLTLELGGNDAAIVLPDVDPTAAAEQIFDAAFMNAGQVCIAVKRVYAHDDVYEDLCAALAKRADEAVVDDGLKQGTQIGPLQNKNQLEKVKGFLEDARINGRIIAGGHIEDRPGYFVRPTIVRDISDGTRLVDEEQFGPVLPIIRFSDTEDALARANSSSMGLGGSIWSRDRGAAQALAARMDAGTVWINQHLDFGPGIPFGGAKQSGLGVEFGKEGFQEFTQLQVINERVD